jgi:hypothetical protein
MPRYFFDTHDGDHLVADEEGQELGGLASVRREALGALADMARDRFPKDDLDTMFVSVRDEMGHVVFRVTASRTIEESPLQTA